MIRTSKDTFYKHDLNIPLFFFYTLFHQKGMITTSEDTFYKPDLNITVYFLPYSFPPDGHDKDFTGHFLCPASPHAFGKACEKNC